VPDPDIRIERKHALGIAGAREIAHRLMQQVEQSYGLACSYAEGADCDTGAFSRPGIDGTVEVGPDTLVVCAKLGILYSSFGDMIEQTIAEQIDELLDAHP
jgi:putative polyhydroxyalkanoate system protein